MTEHKNNPTAVPAGIACLLCYFIPFLGGLLFLFLEGGNRLIRFHAVQSILLWVCFVVLSILLGWIPGINYIAWTFILLVWVFMLYNSLLERQYELPLIGPIARRQAFGPDGPDKGEGEGAPGP